MKINSTQPTFGSLYFNPNKIENRMHVNAMNYILRDASNADLIIKSKNGDMGMFFAKGRESLEEKIADLFKGFKGIKIVHRPDINEEAHFLAATPAIFKKLNEVVK